MSVSLTGTPSTGRSAGATLTVSHTVPSGTTCLVVRVMVADTSTIGSVTWNGTTMTNAVYATVNVAQSAGIWYLVSPEAGTFNIVFTSGGSNDNQRLQADNLLGSHTSTPVGTSQSDTQSGTAPSVAVTSATGELVLDALIYRGSSTPATIGSGQTSDLADQTVDAGSFFLASASNEAGAASVTMSWSLVGANWYTLVSTPFKAAASGTAPRTVHLVNSESVNSLLSGGLLW